MNPNEEYSIKPLNLLAFPKNDVPRCELSGERATVQLITPHCSMYFFTYELAEQAWFGIIKKISHLLGPLQQPPPIVGTNEERSRRLNNIILSKKSLIEFCLSESSKLLSVQKFQLAIPAAIQALKFSKEIDGEKSLTVVEPYLQLAQASLGIKQFNKAEEYLSLARWIVLNVPNCPDKLKAKLHMLIGRAKTLQGLFDDAKTEFALAILHFSHHCGPESIDTSMGYFRLGDVFLAQAGVESALAYFDKVVDIWYKYLSALHNSVDPSFRPNTLSSTETIRIRNSLDGKTENPTSHLEELSEEHLSDGRNHLDQILSHRRRLLGSNHIATGEVEFTMGLFDYFILGNGASAEAYLTNAYQIYESQLGGENSSVQHVASVLDLIRQQS